MNLFWVVICFHSLNYWYLQQQSKNSMVIDDSCDLLSFFELLIFTTTNCLTRWSSTWLWFAFILWTTDIYNNINPKTSKCHELWFAFILWTTDIYNNKGFRMIGVPLVVICFHSLNYWYLQQPESSKSKTDQGCDLLSFFELLIFTTTKRHTFCYKS